MGGNKLKCISDGEDNIDKILFTVVLPSWRGDRVWLMVHDWRSCVGLAAYRGFESLPLRHFIIIMQIVKFLLTKSVAALDGVVAVPCNLQAAKQGRRPL